MLTVDQVCLVGAPTADQETSRADRELKCVAVPLKELDCRLIADPLAPELGIVDVDLAPADFLDCIARDGSAQRFGQ